MCGLRVAGCAAGCGAGVTRRPVAPDHQPRFACAQGTVVGVVVDPSACPSPCQARAGPRASTSIAHTCDASRRPPRVKTAAYAHSRALAAGTGCIHPPDRPLSPGPCQHAPPVTSIGFGTNACRRCGECGDGGRRSRYANRPHGAWAAISDCRRGQAVL